MDQGKIPIKQGYHFLQGFKYIAAHEHELTLPILVVVGTRDVVVSTNAIFRFLKNVSSKDVTLNLMKDSYHAIAEGKD